MYAMLQSVLKLNDLSLRKNNEVIEIIPIRVIKSGVTQLGQDKSAAGYGIEAIPLGTFLQKDSKVTNPSCFQNNVDTIPSTNVCNSYRRNG